MGAVLGSTVATLGLLLGLLASPTPAVATSAPRSGPTAPKPLVWSQSLADPSIAATPWGYVAVGTGVAVPRMRSWDGRNWTPQPPALPNPPAWVAPGEVWASEIVRLRKNRWLLYYAAPVLGLGEGGRCIGVAVASSPLASFRPVGRAPLVCPARARTPRAGDRVRRNRKMPRSGVIDPSLHVDRKGRPLLLYKTQSTPSSIRMVRLRRNGTAIARKSRSRVLLKHHGIVENPVLVNRGKYHYLFLSAGNYQRCGYHTVWLRSRKLWKWKDKRKHTLLNRKKTGICGPGGADVVSESLLGTRIYFHGWACERGPRPCPRRFHALDPYGLPSVRALYGARLGFKNGRPRVKRYLRAG